MRCPLETVNEIERLAQAVRDLLTSPPAEVVEGLEIPEVDRGEVHHSRIVFALSGIRRLASKLILEMHDQPAISSRKAFTLIELLVVILIVGMVSAVVLPTVVSSLSHRQISESARLVQATVEGQRDAAIRANAPRGIRLMPDPAFPGSTTAADVPLAYNRLMTIEPAPDYSEGKVSITDPFTLPNPSAAQVAIPGSSPAAAYPPQALRIEESRVNGQGQPNPRTSWAWNVRVGDRIRIGTAGKLYTICGPMVVLPGAGNPEKFVNYGPPGTVAPMTRAGNDVEFLFVVNNHDDDGSGYNDDGWDGSGWDGKDSDNDGQIDEVTDGPPVDRNGDGQVDPNFREWEVESWLGSELGTLDAPYTIKRLPVPTQGARVVELPAGVVIDATTWDSTQERSRLPVDTDTLYVDLMIAPNGTVVPQSYLPGRPLSGGAPFVHLWLSERSDVYAPSTLPANAPAGTPRLPMPSGVIAGATTVLEGDRRLVTLHTRTGMVTTNSLEEFDAADVGRPFYSAQSGAREAK